MQPIQLFDPGSSTFTYLLVDPHSGDAVIIDPVDHQLERDLAPFRRTTPDGVDCRDACPRRPYNLGGATYRHTGAQAATPQAAASSPPHGSCRDGDTIEFGDETLTAIHTPGHTAGSMSFLWRDHVFTGDTLLIDGCGRTDFQSGSADALYTSITARLSCCQTRQWSGLAMIIRAP